MQNNYSNFLTNFKQSIDDSEKILISSHMGPDNDSVSSCLAMRYILENFYHVDQSKIDIIYSGKFENNWTFLEGTQDIETVDDILNIAKDYDTFIFLDAREYGRFSKDPEGLKDAIRDRDVIVIDHHEFNPDLEIVTDMKVTCINNISCSDLIYEIFLLDKGYLKKEIADIILSGILSDSGNMIFISKDTVKSFDNIKQLTLNSDSNIQELSMQMDGISYNRYKYLAKYIENSQIVNIKGLNYLYSYINEKPTNEQDLADMNDSASIWIQIFQGEVRDVSTTIVTKYKNENNGISVSLRSKKEGLNVSSLMQEMGIGGGHAKASGGLFKFSIYPDITPAIAIDHILDFIRDHDIDINSN